MEAKRDSNLDLMYDLSSQINSIVAEFGRDLQIDVDEDDGWILVCNATGQVVTLIPDNVLSAENLANIIVALPVVAELFRETILAKETPQPSMRGVQYLLKLASDLVSFDKIRAQQIMVALSNV